MATSDNTTRRRNAEPTEHLPVRHIPLAPFDLPEQWYCCSRGECNGDHDRFAERSGGSEDDRIRPGRTYLAKIHGRWSLGTFSEQWYGWSFNEWGASGIALKSVEDLYEVDPTTLDGGS